VQHGDGQPARRVVFTARGLTKVYRMGDVEVRALNGVDLDIYAGEVMGIPQKLYVTQSWSLINMPNIGMHGHSHSNSIVSGSLYYCDMPTPLSNMIFNRHNDYQRLEITPERGRRNIYNTPMNVVVPKAGEVGT